VRPAAAPRLVLRDGVHLFSPRAPHHEVLASKGASSTSPGAPLRVRQGFRLRLGLRFYQSKHGVSDEKREAVRYAMLLSLL